MKGYTSWCDRKWCVQAWVMKFFPTKLDQDGKAALRSDQPHARSPSEG